jgi:hypothetical protein
MWIEPCLQPRLDRRSPDHGRPGFVNIYANDHY